MAKPMIAELMMVAVVLALASPVFSQDITPPSDLDRRVRAFLDSNAGRWDDFNVPETDGKLLYEIVLKNGYTRALEIGTSTGHSTIWIAWALSRTGGKVITVEVKESIDRWRRWPRRSHSFILWQ